MPNGGVKGQNKLLECRAVKLKFVSIEFISTCVRNTYVAPILQGLDKGGNNMILLIVGTLCTDVIDNWVDCFKSEWST
jgi:hypothetical protein